MADDDPIREPPDATTNDVPVRGPDGARAIERDRARAEPDEAPYAPPPLPRWTKSREVAALHDALAHVMADVLSLTALAIFARWNMDAATESFSDVFARRVRAGRRAQETVARRMRALGGPVMLHPTDPSEVPRWMLAGRSEDPVAELVLLTAGTHEFVRSVEAAGEVAREVPDRDCMRAMQRMQRNEERALAELRALTAATVEAGMKRGETRH